MAAERTSAAPGETLPAPRVHEELATLRARIAALEAELSEGRAVRAQLELYADDLRQAFVRLRQEARTDLLTELANYRRFDEALPTEADRARRLRYPLGLLIMDLDGLKAINTRHGHSAGSAVIRRVAEILQATLRGSDLVARVGGDEFAAILPGADLDVALQAGERVRQAVETLAPEWHGQATPRVTISVGAAAQSPDDVDYEALFELADRACFRAKALGGNRVCSRRRDGGTAGQRDGGTAGRRDSGTAGPRDSGTAG